MKHEQTPKINEIELMKQASEGNKEAADKLFRKYESRLFSFTMDKVKDEATAKDIVQNTFKKAWVAMKDGKYTPGKKAVSFTTWLFVILKRSIVEYSRKPSVERLSGSLDQIIENGAEINLVNLENDVEMMVILRDRNLNLYHLLNQLSPIRKRIMILHYFEGMTAREVSEIVGKTVGATKIEIMRGKQDLRDIIEK